MSSDDEKELKERVRNILSEAIDLTEGKSSYVNSVQLYFGPNDVVLDMYFIGPNSKPNAPDAQAQRLQRIVLTYAVAREVADLLTNGVSTWEDAHGITFPLVSSDTFDQQAELDSGEDKNE